MDESGIDTYLYREYGYAPRGQQVFGQVRGRKYQRCGIVAAQMGDRILAPFQYNPNAVRKRLRPLEKGSFVQSNKLREEYDTMEKIQRMRDRQERKRRSASQVFSQLFPPD